MTEDELKSFFERHSIKATINHYSAGKRTIYYATIGEDHLPAILFIHGAPASMTIYKDYFTDTELLGRFSMYAVDRPGFGVTNGKAEPSIKNQAKIISPLVERIHRVHHIDCDGRFLWGANRMQTGNRSSKNYPRVGFGSAIVGAGIRENVLDYTINGKWLFEQTHFKRISISQH